MALVCCCCRVKDDLRGFESCPGMCDTCPFSGFFFFDSTRHFWNYSYPKLVNPDQHTQYHASPTAYFAELSDLGSRVYTEQILTSAKFCWDVEGSGIVWNLEVHAAFMVNCSWEFACMWIFPSCTTVIFSGLSWKGHSTGDGEHCVACSVVSC